MNTVSVEAFAKVNLYLHVCNRLDNGYHELDSLICFAQTGDVITVSPQDHLSLEITGPMAVYLKDEPLDENLVMRAARALQKLCKTEQGAHIVLDKRLPVAAGVGGGSGDAAATLKALCKLWNVFPDPVGMDALTLSLGADVPICMKSHAAHVAGIGEEITPLPPLPEFWMVLVNPMVALSTPAVFKARDSAFSPAMPMAGEYEAGAFIQALKERSNDLTAPAIKLAPEVAQVITVLEKTDGADLFRMSGSGATCFALYASEALAKSAEEAIGKAYPAWWIARGKII